MLTPNSNTSSTQSVTPLHHLQHGNCNVGLLPPTSGSSSSSSAVPTTCDAGSAGQQQSSGGSHHQHSALMQSQSDLETELTVKHPILNNDNTQLTASLSFHHVEDGNDNNITMSEHSSYQHFLNDEVAGYNKCLSTSSVRQSQQTLSLPPPSSSSSVNLEAETVANNYLGLTQDSNINNDLNNGINNHLYATTQLLKSNQQQINDTIHNEHSLLDMKYDNITTPSTSLQKQITTVTTPTVSTISDSNDCLNDIQNHDNSDNNLHHHHLHQNHQNHLHDSYLTKNGLESVVNMAAAENNIDESFNGKTVKRRGRKKKMLNPDGSSPIDK